MADVVDVADAVAAIGHRACFGADHGQLKPLVAAQSTFKGIWGLHRGDTSSPQIRIDRAFPHTVATRDYAPGNLAASVVSQPSPAATMQLLPATSVTIIVQVPVSEEA